MAPNDDFVQTQNAQAQSTVRLRSISKHCALVCSVQIVESEVGEDCKGHGSLVASAAGGWASGVAKRASLVSVQVCASLAPKQSPMVCLEGKNEDIVFGARRIALPAGDCIDDTVDAEEMMSCNMLHLQPYKSSTESFGLESHCSIEAWQKECCLFMHVRRQHRHRLSLFGPSSCMHLQ